MEITSLLLAGGKNKRMNGIPKWSLLINNETMLDRSIKKLADISNRILIVAGEEHELNLSSDCTYVSIVYDKTPYIGPLNGILTGLENCEDNFAFVVAADMPFFSPDLVKTMYKIAISNNFDVVIPSWKGKLQPLHGIYSSSLIASIKSYIQNGNYGLIKWLEQQENKYVLTEQEVELFNLDDRIFFNMNYPEEYQQAKYLAEGEE